MNNRKKPPEFAIIQAFINALPTMDDTAIATIMGWVQVRGQIEIDKRKQDAAAARASPQT